MKVLTFEDLFASDADKSTAEYGLKVAQAIAQEWFNGGLIQNDCQYATRRDWIRLRRLYALGRQDLKPYKDIISREENDLSYLNLDWRPVNILGKFNKILADGIDEDGYDVTVKAIDNTAIESLKKYERDLRKSMLSKDMLEQANQQLGIDLRPKGFVPEDDDELEIHMMLKPKAKIEVAEETLIDYVFASNDYEIIKPLVNADLVKIGLGAIRCYTDKIDGVRVRYVDPEYFIHSYTETPYFNDVYYFGEVVTRTIAELKRLGQFTNEQLNDIANRYAAANDSFVRDYSGDHLTDSVLDFKVPVMEFTYKTTKDIIYKKTEKKKGTKYAKKGYGYNPPRRSDYSRVNKSVNIWYEGSYIIGTTYLYDYKESENVAKDSLNKVLPNYICYAPEMYKGSLTSFSSTIEPICDKMLYVDLKLQHLIAEIKPDGAEINMDKLYELAADTKSNTKEILSLFAVKGIVLSKTITDEGGQESRSRAVEQIRNGVPDNLMHLVQIWEHYYNVIREITGINPFRDGTQRPDTLVGVQQQGLKQSNIATEYITRGSVFITKKTAECITSRINTIFQYSSHLKKIYEDAISVNSVKVLESMKNRHIHSFGIKIEMRPSEEEIMDLNANISLAIQAGDIKVEDKIEIQNIGNYKKANQYLKYRSKKRREQAQEDLAIQTQLQTESQIAATQAAAQEARQNKIFEVELDVQKEAQLSLIRIQEKIATSQIEMQKETEKQGHDMQIEKIKALGQQGLAQFNSQEKQRRKDRDNSQQSRLISQRNLDATPIDFENESSILGQ